MIMVISFCVAVSIAALVYGFNLYNGRPKRANIFKIWLTFTVIIALMPIILNALWIEFFTENNLTISSLLDNGGLFIVSVTIASDAIGRIFANQNASYTTPVGACFLLIIISSFLFAASLQSPSESSLNSDNVQFLSLLIFFMTVISSGLCVLQAEV